MKWKVCSPLTDIFIGKYFFFNKKAIISYLVPNFNTLPPPKKKKKTHCIRSMPMFVLDKTLYSRDFFLPWDLPHPLHHCQNEPSTHRSLYLHLRCNTYDMSRRLETTMDTGRGKFVWGWGRGRMQLGPSNLKCQKKKIFYAAFLFMTNTVMDRGMLAAR